MVASQVLVFIWLTSGFLSLRHHNSSQGWVIVILWHSGDITVIPTPIHPYLTYTHSDTHTHPLTHKKHTHTHRNTYREKNTHKGSCTHTHLHLNTIYTIYTIYIHTNSPPRAIQNTAIHVYNQINKNMNIHTVTRTNTYTPPFVFAFFWKGFYLS